MTTNTWTALFDQYMKVRDEVDMPIDFTDGPDMFMYMSGIAPGLAKQLKDEGLRWDENGITYEIETLYVFADLWAPYDEWALNDPQNETFRKWAQDNGVQLTDDGLDETFINPFGVIQVIERIG